MRISVIERVTGGVVALYPDSIRKWRVECRSIEDLGGFEILLLAPAPAGALVNQAGVVPEHARDFLHRRVGALAHRAQGKTRLGKRPRSRIDSREHAPHSGFIACPKQSIQSLDVLSRMQIGAEL